MHIYSQTLHKINSSMNLELLTISRNVIGTHEKKINLPNINIAHELTYGGNHLVASKFHQNVI